MFYLPLAVVTWLVAVHWLNWRRLADLLPYGLFGSVLATLHDRVVLVYHLWEYKDVGPIDTHAEIALLISLSAAPVFAMRFAQGLKRDGRLPYGRCLKFTAVSMVPEVLALGTGNILYHAWWTVWCSVLAYAPIWLSLWGLYRWLEKPHVSRQQTRNL